MNRLTSTLPGARAHAFRCTRPDPKDLKKRHGARIQPFYCGDCGYIEIYKETKDQRKGA